MSPKSDMSHDIVLCNTVQVQKTCFAVLKKLVEAWGEFVTVSKKDYKSLSV